MWPDLDLSPSRIAYQRNRWKLFLNGLITHKADTSNPTTITKASTSQPYKTTSRPSSARKLASLTYLIIHHKSNNQTFLDKNLWLSINYRIQQQHNLTIPTKNKSTDNIQNKMRRNKIILFWLTKTKKGKWWLLMFMRNSSKLINWISLYWIELPLSPELHNPNGFTSIRLMKISLTPSRRFLKVSITQRKW